MYLVTVCCRYEAVIVSCRPVVGQSKDKAWNLAVYRWGLAVPVAWDSYFLEGLKTVTVKVRPAVFWGVTPCSLS